MASEPRWLTTVHRPTEASVDYPDLWDEVYRLFPELTAEKKALIVSLVVGTCRSCYADNRSCRCGYDS